MGKKFKGFDKSEKANRSRKKKTKLDLELLEKYMDLPLSEHSEPEHSQLVEQGLEQLFLMALIGRC